MGREWVEYLITGSSGFIATNLIKRIATTNPKAQVIGFDLCNSPHTQSRVLDVSEKLPNISGNTIVHLAAITDVRASLEVPKTVIEKNIKSTLRCLDLLKEGHFEKMIFASSYSSSESSNPYLASKLSCESICEAYSKSYDLNISILKLSNVYGPYSIHKNSIIPTLIKNTIISKHTTIFGDGTQERDFVYVDDVVDAIIAGESSYVCSGKLTSLNELIEITSLISQTLLGRKPTIHYELQIKGEVSHPSCASEPSSYTPLDEGLLKTFRWFIKNFNQSDRGYGAVTL